MLEERIEIKSLGAQGDGISAGGALRHISFALPGEEVQVRCLTPTRWDDIQILKASPDRVDPPCPHFGACGGCRLQHFSPALYRTFKRDKILRALEYAGIFFTEETETLVSEVLILEKNLRRRATLQFSLEDRTGQREVQGQKDTKKSVKGQHKKAKGKFRTAKDSIAQENSSYEARPFEKVHCAADEKVMTKGHIVQLGFYERGSHRLVPLATCLVLEPALVALLPFLRTLLEAILPAPSQGSVSLLKSEAGIDIALYTKTPPERDLFFFEGMNDFVQTHSLARFVVNGDVILARQEPYVTFQGVKVSVSAESFLQVNEGAEKAMTSLLQSRLPKGVKRAADLFSGRGLFTFALKDYAQQVDAFEMDLHALKAFHKASLSLPHLRAHQRNLFSQPLLPEELDVFEAVVLDPPREGALAQCQQLARSCAPFICYVSCKPETFARDAKILIEGGYQLVSITPVDQFQWSHHIELVSFFTKRSLA